MPIGRARSHAILFSGHRRIFVVKPGAQRPGSPDLLRPCCCRDWGYRGHRRRVEKQRETESTECLEQETRALFIFSCNKFTIGARLFASCGDWKRRWIGRGVPLPHCQAVFGRCAEGRAARRLKVAARRLLIVCLQDVPINLPYLSPQP